MTFSASFDKQIYVHYIHTKLYTIYTKLNNMIDIGNSVSPYNKNRSQNFFLRFVFLLTANVIF